MRRLWNAPGVMTAALLAGLIMVSTARQTGVTSPDFWWSLLIVLVVLAAGLAFRYLTERPSASNGQRLNRQQPSGLN